MPIRSALGLTLALFVWSPVALGEDSAPAKEYAALLKEYKDKGGVVEFAPKFLAFAEKNAKAPESVEALIWIMRTAAHRPEADKAADVLANQHAANEKVERVCTLGMAGTPFPSAEKLLRGVLAMVEGDAKAQATFNLASHLASKADMINQLKKFEGEQLKAIEERFGPELFKMLREGDTAAMKKEGEKLFEEVVAKYPKSTKLVESAKNELFAARLVVGSDAPEIEGEDLDGKKFKLSDYKGKVVLIDFWGHWCPHCIAMVPHEIELVKKLENKPFALIGVNSGDADLDEVKKENAKLKITWRNFFDGPDQKIANKWKISGFPTLFLIDHKGVIREKFVGRPDEKALDAAVEKLVAEAEKK